MPASPRPQPRGPSPGAVERLYVLWIVSSLLLLLVIAVLTLFITGVLRRQSAAISALDQRLAAIRQSFVESEQTRPAATVPDRRQAAPPGGGEARSSPDAPPVGPGRESAERAPDDAAVQALLGRVLRRGTNLPVVVADPTAAAAALEEILRAAPRAQWAGETWARIAVLARLLEQNDRADECARAAAAAGVVPLEYYDIAARLALRSGRPAEALAFARQLAERTDRQAAARLLLARAYGMQAHYAQADEALDGIEAAPELSPQDKLQLGYLLIDLERWPDLGTLLESLKGLPDELIPERDYLRAVWLIQQNRLAEALAVLDYLLELQPDDYDVRTWRGVALIQAGQFAAARAALAHAEQNPARPEAWYWLGVLEIKRGQPEAAIPYLQKSFAASARFAPAWEALGMLALNRGDLTSALENLSTAVDINPRRASAQFLIALVHAKASRREEAAEALRTAFALDSALLETARQTDVLTALFDPEELSALVPAPPADLPQPASQEPPTEGP